MKWLRRVLRVLCLVALVLLFLLIEREIAHAPVDNESGSRMFYPWLLGVLVMARDHGRAIRPEWGLLPCCVVMGKDANTGLAHIAAESVTECASGVSPDASPAKDRQGGSESSSPADT